MNSWVKRLGQWHLYKSNSHITFCGKPMLGNNYTILIPKEHRKKCELCWKVVKNESDRH